MDTLLTNIGYLYQKELSHYGYEVYSNSYHTITIYYRIGMSAFRCKIYKDDVLVTTRIISNLDEAYRLAYKLVA